MNYSMLRFMFKVLSPLIIVFIFNTSLLAGDSTTFKSGNESEPEQHQVEHKKKGGELAPHATAHGHRAKHHYRYYPNQKVYHDTDRGLYFYQKGDNWEVGTSLPSRLKAGLGESVTIELDTDKPYVHNADHVKKHKPKESVESKKNMWSKLVFILLYAHASK